MGRKGGEREGERRRLLQREVGGGREGITRVV